MLHVTLGKSRILDNGIFSVLSNWCSTDRKTCFTCKEPTCLLKLTFYYVSVAGMLTPILLHCTMFHKFTKNVSKFWYIVDPIKCLYYTNNLTFKINILILHESRAVQDLISRPSALFLLVCLNWPLILCLSCFWVECLVIMQRRLKKTPGPAMHLIICWALSAVPKLQHTNCIDGKGELTVLFNKAVCCLLQWISPCRTQPYSTQLSLYWPTAAPLSGHIR